jgi:hypothetical protein
MFSLPIYEVQAKEDFFCVFEDLYLELSKFGQIEALHVVDNVGDHMIGHVYVKFREEEQASDALMGLSGRYFDGRQLDVEFSPVSDFREARCRDYAEQLQSLPTHYIQTVRDRNGNHNKNVVRMVRTRVGYQQPPSIHRFALGRFVCSYRKRYQSPTPKGECH